MFFDEIDAIAPKRGKDETQVTTRVLAQFLNELDGVEDAGNVMVLAATNRMDMLDDAILRPGRFDHIIEIPPPCDEDRAEICDPPARQHRARTLG
ncbi:MAG: AAA family ATPase [bacterium]